MEPRADGVAVVERVHAPGQGQERIPEGVLDVRLGAEDGAANREDHRTVTLDQDPECVRVIRGDETFQEQSLRHCVVPMVPGIRGNGRRSGGSGSSVPKGIDGGIEMGVLPLLLHGAEGSPYVWRRDGHQCRGRGAVGSALGAER